MEIIRNIKWYHIIVISLFVLLFLFIVNNQMPMSGRTEKYQNETMEETVKEPTDKHDAEIVLYYALWCGYSKAFLPEWQKFEEYANVNLKNIRVTSLQCVDGNEATCHQKGVNGYPTVIIYPKNKSLKGITFEGQRNVESLIKFVNDNI